MAGWSFPRRLASASRVLAVVLAAATARADVGPEDRRAIVRLIESRGGAAADVTPLIEEVNRASQRRLPQPPLVNKLKEGLAKGVPLGRIQAVLRDLVGRFDTARELLGGRLTEAASDRAIEVLAEALGLGITTHEVREIERLAQQGTKPVDGEALAYGAKSWALMKEAGISPDDGLALVAEAIRQGFRSAELVALGRELVGHREDLAAGRISLEAVRQAVARGERPERLFPPRDAAERRRPERPEQQRRERPPRR
jgi:hypothetical protein